ncbi:NUDIX domain-containing protein [Peribacillus sp. NPDC097295]|uniref:NUDIX hydrolase n=1 Tax=Peribacillus sp. NPDC097295 TaxID=3364402 RepID=UPI003827CC8A
MKVIENEMLKIFNEARHPIGEATREEVHRLGHWHEVFHCWFVSREEEVDYLYLQHRCALKKDYPDLLDITAAGHLLADETVHDGVREIKEEIGITVPFDELVSLGVIKDCATMENFIDKELVHLFLYKSTNRFSDFVLQKEEVSGIVKVKLKDFEKLWFGPLEEVHIQGFEMNHLDKRVTVNRYVGRDQFVPHETSYYESMIRSIKKELSK